MDAIHKQRLRIRKHYQNNKQYYKDKAFKYRKELRAWFTNIKKKYVCKICGESDWRCIDFHHRNPKEKKFDVSNMITWGKSRKLILEEIEKCDAVCSNCHRKLTIKNTDM